MSNILDYLAWRGDLTFAAAPFNEVDNLIFAMLSFVDFSDAVSGDVLGMPMKLSDCLTIVRRRYPAGEEFGEVIPQGVNQLFEDAARSRRFADTYVSCYRNVVEESEVTQFAAVTFVMPTNEVYAAFRGTDDTLVGWREDFHLSFSYPVRAQQLAAEYLEEIASAYAGPLYVGGHSKGGNLAVYASLFSPKPVRERIVTAYSNDGPGFIDEIIASPEFAEMEPKLRTLVPQSSVIGMLLGHNERYEVVRSAVSNGILQHDPFSWQVKGPQLEHLEELSQDGKRHSEVFAEWLNQIPSEERRQFTDTVFKILESTGAKTVTDLSTDRMAKFSTIIRSYAELDRVAKENFTRLLLKLAEANLKVKE